MEAAKVEPIVVDCLTRLVSPEAAASSVARKLTAKLASLSSQVEPAIKKAEHAIRVILEDCLLTSVNTYEHTFALATKVTTETRDSVAKVLSGLKADETGRDHLRQFVTAEINSHIGLILDQLAICVKDAINNPGSYGLKAKTKTKTDAPNDGGKPNPFHARAQRLREEGVKLKGIDRRARKVGDKGEETKEEERKD